EPTAEPTKETPGECVKEGEVWSDEQEKCIVDEKLGCTNKNKAGECVECDDEESFSKEEDKCIANEGVDDLLAQGKSDTDNDADSKPAPVNQSQQSHGPLNLPQAQQIPIPADSFYIKAGFN
ncbi:MAG: hypothetical protein KAG61_13355, partial [Bacteriovoracaceae bacterium]|nr:hypothetical protein [Bacteriovoracaceae bacterium]